MGNKIDIRQFKEHMRVNHGGKSVSSRSLENLQHYTRDKNRGGAKQSLHDWKMQYGEMKLNQIAASRPSRHEGGK